MERFAVLIDLASMRLGVNMFRKLYADLSDRGSVEYLKFYNYNTKRHREFRSVIKEYGADVDLPLLGKKRVRIDIRQVIDAVRIASTSSNITTFFLICSEVDADFLLNELKKSGKYIELGVTSPSSLSERAHSVYYLDRSEEVEDVACASIETCAVKDSKVKGDENSIFPFSDIDAKELDDKMAEIDKKILAMIDVKRRKSRDNLALLFGEEKRKI